MLYLFLYTLPSRPNTCLQLLATSAPPPPPPQKKKRSDLKPDTSGSILPTPPRQRQIPHPREGLTRQIPHSPGTENSQMLGVYPGGMLKFRFDRRITRGPKSRTIATQKKKKRKEKKRKKNATENFTCAALRP